MGASCGAALTTSGQSPIGAIAKHKEVAAQKDPEDGNRYRMANTQPKRSPGDIDRGPATSAAVRARSNQDVLQATAPLRLSRASLTRNYIGPEAEVPRGVLLRGSVPSRPSVAVDRACFQHTTPLKDNARAGLAFGH